jgi:hypothetical protein
VIVIRKTLDEIAFLSKFGTRRKTFLCFVVVVDRVRSVVVVGEKTTLIPPWLLLLWWSPPILLGGDVVIQNKKRKNNKTRQCNGKQKQA